MYLSEGSEVFGRIRIKVGHSFFKKVEVIQLESLHFQGLDGHRCLSNMVDQTI